MFCQPAVVTGQYILNGDFENNNAPPGTDQMDMDNAEFNAIVPDCFSFAPPFPYANLDLITTSTWVGPAWSGDWFIGLGYTDRFSMELSGPLIVGQTYQISFYDRAWPGSCSGPITIGLALGPAESGTLIYNAPYSPEDGSWKLRAFSFVAPMAANYISVRMFSDLGCWEHVDDFCLSPDESCANPAVIEMPNVFTPNADGINDRFIPLGTSEIVKGSMEIYDRWGQLIFSSDDLDKGWDGTFEEKASADGVYFYLVSFTTTYGVEDSTQGSVTLLSGARP